MRRPLTLLIALAAFFVVAVPAFAATGYEYKKCSSKSVCPYFVATNTSTTKLYRLWISPACSTTTASFTGNYNAVVKVTNKKFSITYPYRSYGSKPTLSGDMKVTGKVTKKEKVKVTYEILGEVQDDCKNLLGKKTVTLKFVGSRRGY